MKSAFELTQERNWQCTESRIILYHHKCVLTGYLTTPESAHTRSNLPSRGSCTPVSHNVNLLTQIEMSQLRHAVIAPHAVPYLAFASPGSVVFPGPTVVAVSSSAGWHTPVFQPGQRSSSGVPLSAEVMCWPHPAQVALPQLLHSHLRHICVVGPRDERGTGWGMADLGSGRPILKPG